MYVRTDGRTDVQIPPVFYRTSSPRPKRDELKIKKEREGDAEKEDEKKEKRWKRAREKKGRKKEKKKEGKGGRKKEERKKEFMGGGTKIQMENLYGLISPTCLILKDVTTGLVQLYIPNVT